jgi:hypothetical protein
MSKSRDETRMLIEAPFDPSVVSKNTRGFNAVGHEEYTKRLIEATDNCFDFEVEPPIIIKEGQVIIKDRNDSSKSYEAPVAIATGHLTIPGFGRRGGWGVNAIQFNQGEDAIKGATSDLLKRCCMLFGMGLDLYDDSHSGVANPNRPAQSAASNGTSQQTRSTGSTGNDGMLSDGKCRYLAVLLKKAGIEPYNVFKDYTVGDADLPSIPWRKGSGWIDIMKDDSGKIPQEFVHLVGVPRQQPGDPVSLPSVEEMDTAFNGTPAHTPDLPTQWTAANLGLGEELAKQKAAWKARIDATEQTDANWKHLTNGARFAVDQKGNGQTWRFVALAMFAPSFETLSYIEEQSAELTDGLMKAIGERSNYLELDADAAVR